MCVVRIDAQNVLVPRDSHHVFANESNRGVWGFMFYKAIGCVTSSELYMKKDIAVTYSIMRDSNAMVTNHFTMNTTFTSGCVSRLVAALKATITDKQNCVCVVSQREERTKNGQDGKAPFIVYTRRTNQGACYTTASGGREKAEVGVDGRIVGSWTPYCARVCVRTGTTVRTNRTMGVEIETIKPGDGKNCST